MDMELLITKVQERRCLYDSTLPEYRDQSKRFEAWREIGRELEISPQLAKITWEKIRRCLSNAVNRRKNNIKRNTPYKYEQSLSFLLPYYCSKERLNSLKSDDDSQDYECFQGFDDMEMNDSNNFSMAKENEINAHEETPNAPEMEHTTTEHNQHTAESKEPQTKKFAPKKKESFKFTKPRLLTRGFQREPKRDFSCNVLDDTDMFFLSLAKTAKTFPLVEQAQIKLEVSKSVLMAQIRLCEQGQLSEVETGVYSSTQTAERYLRSEQTPTRARSPVIELQDKDDITIKKEITLLDEAELNSN